MMIAHVFTTLQASNSPHRRFCRSAVRGGALPTPPPEDIGEAREKRLQRVCLPFGFLLSVSRAAALPQRCDHAPVTVTATAATDSPPDPACLLPLQGSRDDWENVFTGAHQTPSYARGL